MVALPAFFVFAIKLVAIKPVGVKARQSEPWLRRQLASPNGKELLSQF